MVLFTFWLYYSKLEGSVYLPENQQVNRLSRKVVMKMVVVQSQNLKSKNFTSDFGKYSQSTDDSSLTKQPKAFHWALKMSLEACAMKCLLVWAECSSNETSDKCFEAHLHASELNNLIEYQRTFRCRGEFRIESGNVRRCTQIILKPNPNF